MGGKFDKTCGKRIKLDQKFNEIGYHRIRIGCRSHIVQFAEIANPASFVQFCDRSEILESDRISNALHREFLDSFYKVTVSINSYKSIIKDLMPTRSLIKQF